jgi:5'-nucleotidase
VISGFRVSWDSSKPSGQRVLGIWLTKESHEPAGDYAPALHMTNTVDGAAIERRRDGRKYKIVTREYMAQGHDGFVALQNQRYLIDDEGGHLFSAIVRKYLMGKPIFVKRYRIQGIKHPAPVLL